MGGGEGLGRSQPKTQKGKGKIIFTSQHTKLNMCYGK